MPTIITGGNTSGGSGSLKYGYFHDGGFYKHREEVGGEYVYTDPMTLKEKVIYTDMSTARQYLYDGTSLVELNGALFKMHVAVEDVVFVDGELLSTFNGYYSGGWSGLYATIQSYITTGKTVFAKYDSKNYAHAWLDSEAGEILFAFNDVVYRLKTSYGIQMEYVSANKLIDPATGQIKPSMVPYVYDNIEKGYLHEGVFYQRRTGSGTTEDPYVYTQPYTPKEDTLYIDLGDNFKGYLYVGGSFIPFGGSDGSHPYISLERLRPYLYKVTFDTLPEDNGGDSPALGGCSSYVQNGKLYSNLDWDYSETASFRVITKDFDGQSFVRGLNDGQLDDAMIAQLPYRVHRGINNYGIKVAAHVLYNDWSWDGCGDKSINLTRLPYLVLTRVKSMDTIATDLDGVLNNLSVPSGLAEMEYLLQLIVTDGTTTYAIMPPTSANQSYVLTDITAYPKLTNFRWIGGDTVARSDEDIQTRPTGIERYNLMPCDLSELRFTKAYETADRLSEFIGLDDTTKDSTDAELEAIYDEAKAEYLVRERDGKTWQTMESVIYGEKMESLWIQENWEDNVFVEIPEGGGGGLEQYATLDDFPETGNVAIAYCDKSTNGLYRWDEDTSTYITIGAKAWPYPGPAVYNGVYIKYTDGTVSPYDTLAEDKTPVGVAVIYENETYRLVMHPNAQNNVWQSPNGAVNATTKSGKTNTDMCLSSTYDCPAARWARDCVYADGSIGWLPSMEELGAFVANIEQVNTAMELIGGTPIATADTWTSTESNKDVAWCWSGSGFSTRGKPTSYRCRSVCAF